MCHFKQKAISHSSVLRSRNTLVLTMDFPCSGVMLSFVISMAVRLLSLMKIPLVTFLQLIKTAGVKRASGSWHDMFIIDKKIAKRPNVCLHILTKCCSACSVMILWQYMHGGELHFLWGDQFKWQSVKSKICKCSHLLFSYVSEFPISSCIPADPSCMQVC